MTVTGMFILGFAFGVFIGFLGGGVVVIFAYKQVSDTRRSEKCSHS